VRLDGGGLTENALNLAAEVFELTLDEAATIFGAGLYTVGFYGQRGVFGLKPSAAAAAIREFAYLKMATQMVNAGK
jgi:hypothetical protein